MAARHMGLSGARVSRTVLDAADRREPSDHALRSLKAKENLVGNFADYSSLNCHNGEGSGAALGTTGSGRQDVEFV